MGRKRPYKVRRCEDGPGFDAVCRVCGAVSVAWDFARNARWAARSHVQTEHAYVPIKWPPVPQLEAQWKPNHDSVREEDL